MTAPHLKTRRRRYASRTRAIRSQGRHWTLEQRPLDESCLCPGCYFVATESNDLCLRCTLEGCDNEENRHS